VYLRLPILSIGFALGLVRQMAGRLTILPLIYIDLYMGRQGNHSWDFKQDLPGIEMNVPTQDFTGELRPYNRSARSIGHFYAAGY
jgi:hypothetical protein